MGGQRADVDAAVLLGQPMGKLVGKEDGAFAVKEVQAMDVIQLLEVQIGCALPLGVLCGHPLARRQANACLPVPGSCTH